MLRSILVLLAFHIFYTSAMKLDHTVISHNNPPKTGKQPTNKKGIKLVHFAAQHPAAGFTLVAIGVLSKDYIDEIREGKQGTSLQDLNSMAKIVFPLHVVDGVMVQDGTIKLRVDED